MARRTAKTRTATLVSFCLIALSTVAANQPHPPANPSTSNPDAEAAYSQALRTIDALHELPPGSSPFIPDPYQNSFFATLFPNQHGPIANAIRIVYRIRSQSWLPKFIAKRLGGSSWTSGKKREEVRGKALKVIDLLEHAIELGHQDALYTMADVSLFPPPALPMNVSRAFAHYSRHAELTGNPDSQAMLGFFYATGYGGVVDVDQAQATTQFTFAALSGNRRAQMALGYRHWAGIAVNEDCMTALSWYESAAERSISIFQSGPPGGRTMPPTITRLSDLDGGVYGPGASVASTGSNAGRSVMKAANSRAAGETWEDVLEYYQYHADRDEIDFSYRLGKIYYHGSVYNAPGGAASGAEGVGLIPRDYHRALAYFVSITKLVWPQKDLKNPLAGKKQVEDRVAVTASMAAGYIGRMYLRGEGMPSNPRIAKMWFERGAEYSDRECLNGLALIYRDGLLDAKPDLAKAITYFTAAAGQDLAEAQVQLGKHHYELGEYGHATTFLESAIRHGSPYEAYYYLAEMHSNQAHDERSQAASSVKAGSCSLAVSFYKLIAERGSWEDDLVGEAETMWAEGTLGGISGAATISLAGSLSPEQKMRKEGAKLRWMIAAESGSEVAQNNLAYLMDQEIKLAAKSRFSKLPSNETARNALTQWIRSAAQRNVDALVKVGDYFYNGIGVENESERARWEKAAGYYHAAVDTQVSALAMWNLGWMYENGIGVDKDFHLAKRYYDMALETNAEAKLPVYLSLCKLYARSIWHTMTGGTQKSLVLWGALFQGEDDDDETWYPGKAREQWLSRWKKAKNQMGEGKEGLQLEGGDLGKETRFDDDDAVQWALDRKREDYERAQAEKDADGGFGPDDFLDGGIVSGTPRHRATEDDPVEELMFMALLCVVLGLLIYARTRWVARRQEDERRLAQDIAVVPPPL